MRKQVFFLVFLITISAEAQPKFIIKYKLRKSDLLSSVVESKSDSSYIFGGMGVFRDTLNNDIGFTSMLKTDYSGNFISFKYYDIALSLAYKQFPLLISDYENKNFFVQLGCFEFDSVTNNNKYVSAIGKLDKDLNLQNVKELALSRSDFSYYMAPTNDGGFALLGHTHPNANPTSIDSSKVFIIKFDSLLNQQWCKIYGDTANCWSAGIYAMPDSGYMVCGGTSQFNNDPINYPYRNNCFIMRLDKNGNRIWCKRTVGNVEHLQYSGARFALAADSTIIISYGLTGGVGSYSSFAKMDMNGNLIWHKFQNTDCCGYLKATKDSGVMKVSDQTTYVDKFGNVSSRTYHNLPFTYSYYNIIFGSDSSYVIAGTEYEQNPPYRRNMLIVKCDTNFVTSCYTNTTNFNVLSSTSGVTFTDWAIPDSLVVVSEHLVAFSSFDSIPAMQLICSNSVEFATDNSDFVLKIYPNPTKGIFNLQLQNIKETFNYEVSDVYGRKVLSSKGNSTDNKIDLSEQPQGIYIVSANLDGKLWVEKIIKE